MQEIQAAKQSPRFENDILYWYTQNTFMLKLTLEITEDGIPYIIQPSDIIEVVFKSDIDSNRHIKRYTFTNIVDNTINLEMDAKSSKCFRPDTYYMGITLLNSGISTLLQKYQVVVEEAVI